MLGVKLGTLGKIGEFRDAQNRLEIAFDDSDVLYKRQGVPTLDGSLVFLKKKP